MDTEEGECPEELTVDLSKQTLRKIERANNEQKQAAVLILNDNEIQRLDNLESYSNLKELFLFNNHIIRMFGVSQLIHLKVLDLSNNSLVTIEGLKDLKNLKELHLAKNRIKIIEHLNSNLELEKIDLSDNNITHVSDVSHLKNLKVLHLHGNKITHLRQCEKNLPENIEILTLHNNLICDLNEVSHLVQFNSFKELSFSNNPCINFTDEQNSFNYRPFIKNWCSSLITLDGEPLDDIECLKAEWLYSQGRGRSFKPGEQAALVEYLINVCPIKEPNDDAEEFKKLKLILSKAQQHQKQLREQLSTGSLPTQECCKTSRKKLFSVPERMVTSFQDLPMKDRRNSPDLMTRSLDSGFNRNSPSRRGSRGKGHQTPLQTSTTFIPIPDTLISPEVCRTGAPFLTSHPRPSSISSRTSQSSSRNSPRSTPETKRKTSAILMRRQSENSSPYSVKKQGKLICSRSSTPLGSGFSPGHSPMLSGRGSSAKELEGQGRGTSEEDDSETTQERGQRISVNHQQQQKISQKRLVKKRWDAARDGNVRNAHSHAGKQLSPTKVKQVETIEKLSDTRAWKAAVCIQRRWRGYRARNLSSEVLAACKDIQLSRMQDYITNVVVKMEATRVALEGNRKLQVLQMQAINALWKKMIALQPSDPVENSTENKFTLQELMTTCVNLNKQVEELQVMMKNMQQVVVPCQSAPMATQTEIVAVHTPHDDGKKCFPYAPLSKNPEDENFFWPNENNNSSGVPGGDERGFIPSAKTDSSEMCTTKNLEGTSTEQEVSIAPEELESNCAITKLAKPLDQHNETATDLSSSTNEDLQTKIDQDANDGCEKGCNS